MKSANSHFGNARKQGCWSKQHENESEKERYDCPTAYRFMPICLRNTQPENAVQEAKHTVCGMQLVRTMYYKDPYTYTMQ